MEAWARLLVEFIELFFVWRIVEHYEEGVVLRLGKYHRTVKPGRVWVLPFGIDVVMTHSVKTVTRNLSSQTLLTKDGETVVIALVIKFRVTDIQKFLLEVGDEETNGDEVLVDMAYGMLASKVQNSDYEDLSTQRFVDKVRTKIRQRCHRLGCELEQVWVTDCSPARAFRLVGE